MSVAALEAAALVRLLKDGTDDLAARFFAEAAATADPVLATAFLRVTQLMDPPAALFAPEISRRVPG